MVVVITGWIGKIDTNTSSLSSNEISRMKSSILITGGGWNKFRGYNKLGGCKKMFIKLIFSGETIIQN